MVRFPRWLALGLVAGLLPLGLYAADDKKDDKDDPFAALIGKPAPQLQADFALNGKPTKLSDMKGKVVLVDFWAVWCGPCVKTFPHLIELNNKYKDKGLEVVGATTYYEVLDFDKEAGKLKKLEDKMTKEQEQTMLKSFAAHHKLDYLLLAMNREEMKEAQQAYKVRGIPQVVLIDRKGNVQMVKVGASEENAKAIDEKIKELLAE